MFKKIEAGKAIRSWEELVEWSKSNPGLAVYKTFVNGVDKGVVAVLNHHQSDGGDIVARGCLEGQRPSTLVREVTLDQDYFRGGGILVVEDKRKYVGGRVSFSA